MLYLTISTSLWAPILHDVMINRVLAVRYHPRAVTSSGLWIDFVDASGGGGGAITASLWTLILHNISVGWIVTVGLHPWAVTDSGVRVELVLAGTR